MSLLVAAAREGLQLPGAVGLMSPRVEMSKYGDTVTTLAGEGLAIWGEGQEGLATKHTIDSCAQTHTM